MLSVSSTPIPRIELKEKIQFSSPLFKPSKIKEISDTGIEFASFEDKIGKVIALKAPVIKIQALISASKKLVIHTDLLILNGAYITEPKNWDIQAKEVRVQHLEKNSQWITKLIQESNGVKYIKNSNFNSQKDPDCNFEITQKEPLGNKIMEIASEIKDFKDKLFNWR